MKEIDYRFIGACGLYCGECDVYLAFKNNDQKLKEEIARDHNLRSSYVHVCIECPEFPCEMLDEFHKKGYQKARKNLYRMKEIGVEKWLEEKQK